MSVALYLIDPFREAYPVFSSKTTWPDDVLLMAMNEAEPECGGSGWGTLKNEAQNFKRRGMFLYAAHWLATTYPKGAADMAAQSGASRQQVTSKSVGDESVSFATIAPGSIREAGDSWLLTTAWGQQFVRLRRRAGAGAFAL